MTTKPIGYEVTNRHTGKVTKYKSAVRASRACDRMDNAYGAIICTRRAVWGDAPVTISDLLDAEVV